MLGDRLEATVLSVQEIPNAHRDLLDSLEVPAGFNSLGIVTCDIDDVAYAAIDESTKKADVIVVYAKSMYAGAGNASTKLAGEFIGIIAGPDPAEVRSGLRAFMDYVENDACFYSANEDDSIPYFAHTISRGGSYLSAAMGIPEGQPIAYLIGPPNEAMIGLDAALKVAQVEMKCFYGPPSETNFAGGLLTGLQADCKAACDAFAEAVIKVATTPCVIESDNGRL